MGLFCIPQDDTDKANLECAIGNIKLALNTSEKFDDTYLLILAEMQIREVLNKRGVDTAPKSDVKRT